jgi:hypothetical protein
MMYSGTSTLQNVPNGRILQDRALAIQYSELALPDFVSGESNEPGAASYRSAVRLHKFNKRRKGPGDNNVSLPIHERALCVL